MTAAPTTRPIPRQNGWRRVLRRAADWRPQLSVEALALLASLYFTVFCNRALWRAFAAATDLHALDGWLTALSMAVAITGLQAVALALVLHRRTARPLLSVLVVLAALASYPMDRYGVYLDPDMVRNVLHTEAKEAGELATPGLFAWLAGAVLLPMAVLWRVRLRRFPWRTALLRRGVALAVTVAASLAAMLLSFQDLSALMRNHHDLRYLITPGNLVVSTVRAASDDRAAAAGPRRPLGTDARLLLPPGHRPRLLVVVVGETVRARNWGLNGYRRQTTPELARLDVLNFSDVTACGSSTEVSLPCMFSARGRRDYDATAIRRSESLLHVLDHAGVATLWRDNQTGCKGVCDGLPFVSYLHARDRHYCDDERCLDEVLLADLARELDPAPVDRVVVLHQLGNHGPAYSRRYPPAYRHFVPDCRTPQLGDCSTAQIVNAYDNAILYTDHFLARTIALLQAQSAYDTAMVYVSDHGESLGENHLFLHGVPYAIAPDVQLKVPMVAWLSPALRRAEGFDRGCLRRVAAQPASHDNLFSSVLGLMRVQTTAYDRGEDLFAACRSGPLAAATAAAAASS